MLKKGLIIVISAPSGAGKSTLYKGLLRTVPDLVFSVSYTTRPPRRGEKNGKDYFFVSENDFKRMIKRKEFVEWAMVHDNYYGTSRSYIEKTIRSGKSIILEIDVQGGARIKRLYPDAVLIFVMTPTLKELERRLRNRKKDSETVIRKRLKNARHELKFMSCYDYLVINDRIPDALEELEAIISTENHRMTRIDRPKFR